jgi:hypothetical protein
LIANGNSLLAFNANKPPDFNQYLSMPSRSGDALPITERMWSSMVVSNNTFDTSFNTTVDDICSDRAGCTVLSSFSKGVMQNNIFIGFLDSNGPGFNSSLPAVYCDGICNKTYNQNVAWQWVNNMGFNTRNYPTGSGNLWDTNPLVVANIPDISTLAGETAALVWNMNLTSSSPAIGAGIENSSVPATDYNNANRPNPPSIGALEFASNPSTSSYFGGSVVFGGSGTF